MTRATRYHGRPCARHPELQGERRKAGGECLGCERERNRRGKRRNPARIASEQARNRRREKLPHRKAKSAARRAIKKQARVTLTTAEHQRIVALYAEAARRTAETGIAHHVDHDVPLALGGLHHPDNLLVVPASINLAKGARYGSTLEFILS